MKIKKYIPVKITKRAGKQTPETASNTMPAGHFLVGFLLDEVVVGKCMQMLRVENSHGDGVIGYYRSTPVQTIIRIEPESFMQVETCSSIHIIELLSREQIVWPRFAQLPESDREEFREWMKGRTVPWGNDFFYPWDWFRWRSPFRDILDQF